MAGYLPGTPGGGGGGGITSIPTGNTVWVDQVNGSAGGVSGRQDRAFDTVAGALAVAVSGDLVKVGPGTYAESGLTIPAGVRVAGCGWQLTTIGDSAAVSDVLTLSSGSGLAGVTVQCPAGVGLAGVAHSAGTSAIDDCNLAGDGLTGAGLGISKTGSGKLIGGNPIRCETGGLAAVFSVSGGVLALDDCHIPQSAGTIDAVLSASATGTFQAQGFNVGNSNATDGVKLEGTGTARLYAPNISAVSTAVHIAADGVTFESTGGRFAGVTLSVLVDPALTGTGTSVRTIATQLEPLFSFPPAAAGNTDFVVSFSQAETNTREARQRIIGQGLALGFPELGSALWAGRGAPYSSGIKVVSSDNTATGTTIGGNLTDESAAAESRSGSTFTWQGTAANHCLYFASARKNPAGTPLKSWGLLINQVAATGAGGAYVFEIWDGAAWSEVGVMAVSEDEKYRYGDSVFLRASSLEDLLLGITSATTWATTTVDGLAAYWARIRIATAPATLPTFERWRLLESTTEINGLGQRLSAGLAQFRTSVSVGGNVWGAAGSTVDGSVTVGSGPSWSHALDKSKLNANGDAISTQYAIPLRVCTAHSIRVRVLFNYAQFSAAPTITGRIIGVQRVGALVADPGGGVVPIARTEAATTTLVAKAGFEQARALTTSDVGKIQSEVFGPYRIDDLATGDLILFQLELTSDGGGGGAATDLEVFAIELDAVAFTDGGRI